MDVNITYTLSLSKTEWASLHTIASRYPADKYEHSDEFLTWLDQLFKVTSP